MIKNIRKEVFYRCTKEELWNALTDPGEISLWLMSTTDFKAIRGEKFTMQAKPMGNWDGKIYGEIIIADKPDTLCYTWKGSQMNYTTELKWTLIAKNKGTLLVMEHTGFAGFSGFILGTFHAMGWKKFLTQLKNRAEHGEKKV
jgi:uncharacterized protein YndB with AHSA1/START domain